jgi:chromosome segregation ATPase
MRFELHHYFHTDKEDLLEKIFSSLTTLRKEFKTAMSDLTDSIAKIRDEVTEQNTVIQSAVTLLNGLSASIAEVQAKLEAATSDVPAAVAALQELTATIDSETASLAAAVAANTPAEPTV